MSDCAFTLAKNAAEKVTATKNEDLENIFLNKKKGVDCRQRSVSKVQLIWNSSLKGTLSVQNIQILCGSSLLCMLWAPPPAFSSLRSNFRIQLNLSLDPI